MTFRLKDFDFEPLLKKNGWKIERFMLKTSKIIIFGRFSSFFGNFFCWILRVSGVKVSMGQGACQSLGTPGNFKTLVYPPPYPPYPRVQTPRFYPYPCLSLIAAFSTCSATFIRVFIIIIYEWWGAQTFGWGWTKQVYTNICASRLYVFQTLWFPNLVYQII